MRLQLGFMQCHRLHSSFLCYLALVFFLKGCPDMPQSDLSVQRNLSYQDRQEIGCVIRFNWKNHMFRLAMTGHPFKSQNNEGNNYAIYGHCIHLSISMIFLIKWLPQARVWGAGCEYRKMSKVLILKLKSRRSQSC